MRQGVTRILTGPHPAVPLPYLLNAKGGHGLRETSAAHCQLHFHRPLAAKFSFLLTGAKRGSCRCRPEPWKRAGRSHLPGWRESSRVRHTVQVASRGPDHGPSDQTNHTTFRSSGFHLKTRLNNPCLLSKVGHAWMVYPLLSSTVFNTRLRGSFSNEAISP